LVSFFAITIVPIGVLVWLTWRIVNQDRALEQQTIRDRVERAADAISEQLRRELARLEAGTRRSPDSVVGRDDSDALIITFVNDRVSARPPRRLLYYPTMPSDEAVPRGDRFTAVDSLELRERDYPRAVAELEKLRTLDDRQIRAEALLRLARIMRKEQQAARSLPFYDQLAQLDDVSVAGVPADLVARDARCAVLADLGRAADLRREVAALRADLIGARWRLDRATYRFYVGRVQTILAATSGPSLANDTALALANSVEALWADWRRSRLDGVARGWRIAGNDRPPVSILWLQSRDTLTGLVAGPRFMERRLQKAWLGEKVAVGFFDADGKRLFGDSRRSSPQSATRTAAESGLPWSLRVSSIESGVELAQLAARRRLLLAGLGLTSLLIVLGGYFTARATTRELAVARMESDFVAAVSHEFRTPLTSLRHLTELLERDEAMPDDRRRQYYAVLSREAERLQRMVEGLLDFGRMEAGQREYSLEAVDPAALVDVVVDEFRSDLGRAGRPLANVVTDVRVRGARVPIDRQAMGHALRNLLDNAVKYSPDASLVRVELESQNGHVAIHVRDQGVGIPGDEQATIFEKFVRGSASRRMSVKGTGVGLAIVRHIVRAHGGAITVDSEPGKGSTFTIVLPVISSPT
jgi:signal transduction histidine kinase